MGATISYDPSREPAGKDIGGADSIPG